MQPPTSLIIICENRELKKAKGKVIYLGIIIITL